MKHVTVLRYRPFSNEAKGIKQAIRKVAMIIQDVASRFFRRFRNDVFTLFPFILGKGSPRYGGGGVQFTIFSGFFSLNFLLSAIRFPIYRQIANKITVI